jgi:hypothetical protein
LLDFLYELYYDARIHSTSGGVCNWHFSRQIFCFFWGGGKLRGVEVLVNDVSRQPVVPYYNGKAA